MLVSSGKILHVSSRSSPPENKDFLLTSDHNNCIEEENKNDIMKQERYFVYTQFSTYLIYIGACVISLPLVPIQASSLPRIQTLHTRRQRKRQRSKIEQKKEAQK
ncbi:hypothetical protein QML37_30545, partial [Klebsiella pneumoniae]|uniref:hypothetical protein n=1 Tax=Klebsiella pneumoniae TaxID=573 RepID=UPI003A7FBAEC